MWNVHIMSLYTFENVATVSQFTHYNFISLMFVARSVELGMVCDAFGLGQSLHIAGLSSGSLLACTSVQRVLLCMDAAGGGNRALCSGQPTGDILGFYFVLPSSTVSEKWNEMGFVAFCCLHFSWTWLAMVPHSVRPFLPHSFFSSGDRTNWCPICLGHSQFMRLVLGWLFIPSPFTFKSDPVWTWIIQSPCEQWGLVLENGAVPS